MRGGVRTTLGIVVGALAVAGLAASAATTQNGDGTIAFPHDGDRMTPDVQTSMVATVCVQCHTDRRKPGGVSFEHLGIDDIARNGELAERMLAKLRAGMMPPPNAPKRPDQSAVRAFVVSLEKRIDAAARLHPHPGSRRS